MRWDCSACGCQSIAPDLTECPQCFKPKAQELPAEPATKAKTSRKTAPQGQEEGSQANA